jgi:mevalonate kinase
MKEDVTFFKENIEANQSLLEQLGVVSEETKQLLFQLREYGVGKITGGGGKKKGSGYVLFFCNNISECKKVLDKKSISYLSFIPSYTGLTKDL